LKLGENRLLDLQQKQMFGFYLNGEIREEGEKVISGGFWRVTRDIRGCAFDAIFLD
jgi:hypothetical protein